MLIWRAPTHRQNTLHEPTPVVFTLIPGNTHCFAYSADMDPVTQSWNNCSNSSILIICHSSQNY